MLIFGYSTWYLFSIFSISPYNQPLIFPISRMGVKMQTLSLISPHLPPFSLGIELFLLAARLQIHSQIIVFFRVIRG